MRGRGAWRAGKWHPRGSRAARGQEMQRAGGSGGADAREESKSGSWRKKKKTSSYFLRGGEVEEKRGCAVLWLPRENSGSS